MSRSLAQTETIHPRPANDEPGPPDRGAAALEARRELALYLRESQELAQAVARLAGDVAASRAVAAIDAARAHPAVDVFQTAVAHVGDCLRATAEDLAEREALEPARRGVDGPPVLMPSLEIAARVAEAVDDLCAATAEMVAALGVPTDRVGGEALVWRREIRRLEPRRRRLRDRFETLAQRIESA